MDYLFKNQKVICSNANALFLTSFVIFGRTEPAKRLKKIILLPTNNNHFNT